MQIQGDTANISDYSDDTQSNLLSKRPMMAKQGLSMQMWLMIIALVLLMIILLIMVMKNKQPIYLKPKNQGTSANSPMTSTNTNSNLVHPPTMANENEEVLKSEMQSLRQTAVSMSVSEKTGANQIVQDWLDDSSPEGSTDDDATETENKE
jgi:hypothetical protein